MTKKIIVTIVAVIGMIAFLLPGCGGPSVQLCSKYIGSGNLDGYGIPLNFFNDTNTRKAFCYAFDYDTYIHDALSDQGVQMGSPVVDGLYGYCNTTPMYNYNITEAKYYFAHSGWGNLLHTGFQFTVLYNAGNLARKTACELLQSGAAACSVNCTIAVQPLAWPTILGKIFGTRDMPMFQIGWLPDYPHADDFIVPFMATYGTFSYFQGYGNAALDDQIHAALLETDYATQMADYAALQQRYYDDAPGIVLAQPLARRYFTAHIDGFVYNPCESSTAGRLLNLTKGQNVSGEWDGALPYKNPGIFTYETIGDAESLDPAWCYDTASGEQIEYMYETLLTYNGSQTGAFIPLLATNWSFNNATNELAFTINRHATFWDSNNLTPEDVEYSIERAMVQDRPGGPAWMLFQPLIGGNVYGLDDTDWATINASVTVSGNDVVFHLCDAGWELPFEQILCGQWASIVEKSFCVDHSGGTPGDWDGTEAGIASFKHPQDPGDTYLFNHCMGTGPWKLTTWSHGTEIDLEDNASYWNAANTPVPFTNVVTKIVTTWLTRKSALLGGDADLVDVPAANYGDMDAETGLNVYRSLPSLSIDAFFFNMMICG